MAAMPADGIYQYAPEELDGLAGILEPTLPYSIPLLRRLQLPAKRQETAVFATFPPSCVHTGLPSLFTVGILDCSSPWTNAWLFNSLEMYEPTCDITQPLATFEQEESKQAALNQLLGILYSFQSHSARTRVSYSNKEDIITLGTVHSKLAALLFVHASQTYPSLVTDGLNPFSGPRFGKYIFRAKNESSSSHEGLPLGLYFDSIRISDHDLILANNKYIGNSQNILQLPYGAGIRSAETSELVAWGFIGVEGGIRTLHVMPEYRRLGLGKRVAVQVVHNGLPVFGITEGGSSEAWAYADIAPDNPTSIALFTGLGGRWAWDHYWIRLDLTKLPPRDDAAKQV